jgi:DNA-binding NarL/FixJ family response regulator
MLHGVMKLEVLIVDDHAEFRAFARTLLDVDGDFVVTGEASDGQGALAAVDRLRPDVVLLDVQMPGLDGFEVAERLADTPGAPRVVLTSTRVATDYGDRLLSAPIDGFMPKHDLSAAALAALVAR